MYVHHTVMLIDPTDDYTSNASAEVDKVEEQLSLNNDHEVQHTLSQRYTTGMPNSLKSGGCQNPCGDAKIPREFYSGMPNSLGYHIHCDTGGPSFLGLVDWGGP